MESDVIISSRRDLLYRMVNATPALWQEWGNAETLLLGGRLRGGAIDRPVYITGLARGGTTILLELLASHPQVESHRYKDFPFLPNIYTWRQYLRRFQKRAASPQERSHRDGLMVTADSPEAFEEMLWMRFFPQAHDDNSGAAGPLPTPLPQAGEGSGAKRRGRGDNQFLDKRCRNAILDNETNNSAFEIFYRDHIRKLLLAADKKRYAAKGNYNISRLPYLRKLFPDARFIVAIRHPVAHIASLMKQHKLMSELQTKNPALLRYMRQAGHFEFGLDRRIIRLGDEADAVRQAWNEGREAEGWARYWNSIYAYLRRVMQDDPALASSMLVVPYETLCGEPEKTMATIFNHAQLSLDADLQAQWKGKLHLPTYYQAEFSDDERAAIRHHTEATAAHFGYEF